MKPSDNTCVLCSATKSNCAECKAKSDDSIICTLCTTGDGIFFPPDIGNEDCSVALVGPDGCQSS